MTRYFRQVKSITEKPQHEVSLGDVVTVIAGFQKFVMLLVGVVAALGAGYAGVHTYLGGTSGESPGTFMRSLDQRLARQDTMHRDQMRTIEGLALAALKQNQYQSYQLCLLQPRAQATECALLLVENAPLDSALRARRPR